ncbi:MAG: tRNA threonylcarbamoyladenosine dehydratase [Burkholderiaceae bacterium]
MSVEQGRGGHGAPGPDIAAERRFASAFRLLGPAAGAALAAGHVVVVGIGGVGSWAAEALARSGVGRLTLIDLDHVAESNVNRQVHALESTLGAAKVSTMAARIGQISPACRVGCIEDFITETNADALLPADADVIIDAIDQTRPKATMIALARRRRQAIVVCGAAGGRLDPLRLARADLARTRGDALLASVRARLRREHGFTRDPKRAFGVTAIYSDEQVAGSGSSGPAGAPLACAGYGSLVTVTATMGMAAAAFAIDRLALG